MWTHKNTFAIGGLENVGYAKGKDNLIVLSSQGQGIFDGLIGEKIARQKHGGDWWEDFNQDTNSVIGFDILSDIEIPTHGLYGGDHLPKVTRDGWSLQVTQPKPGEKPFENYLVQEIYLVSPEEEKVLIAKDGPCELRAFGFSDTGRSFIVAFSCELIIYSRY